jgi:hypothetical protein
VSNPVPPPPGGSDSRPPGLGVYSPGTVRKARTAAAFAAVFAVILCVAGAWLTVEPFVEPSGNVPAVASVVGLLIVVWGVATARCAYRLYGCQARGGMRAVQLIWLLIFLPVGIFKTALDKGFSYVGAGYLVTALVMAAVVVVGRVLIGSALHDLLQVPGAQPDEHV